MFVTGVFYGIWIQQQCYSRTKLPSIEIWWYCIYSFSDTVSYYQLYVQTTFSLQYSMISYWFAELKLQNIMRSLCILLMDIRSPGDIRPHRSRQVLPLEVNSYHWKPTNFDIYHHNSYHMMTSSNGNIFRVTGHLCGEFTGHRWIPHT